MAGTSPKLKPLLLPQLVEERKRTEERQSLILPNTMAVVNNHSAPADGTGAAVYRVTSTSSSDVTIPITPTFSARGHSRYGSSCSSLDLLPTPCDSPCSPVPILHTPVKRVLPDVQEEPTEHDDEATLPPENVLYCLCDEACIHRDDVRNFDFDYDLGCLSDGDFADRFSFKRREPESAFARLGSRFSNMARWRSSKRPPLTASPTCEVSFENAYPMSLAASSRSSSLSGPSYGTIFDRSPDLAKTSQLASWQSIESINSPSPVDVDEAASVRASIERDRALATTPLLPPLTTAPLPEDDATSPLEPPAVAPPPNDVQSPALSAHPSNTSITSPLALMSPEIMPWSLHSKLPECDKWSSSLGHANFTIFPEPYQPPLVDLDTFRKFLEDWDTARVSYTHHLLRTGEHYGTTGKIYALTEAKWAAIEDGWKGIHDGLLKQIHAVVAQQSACQPRSSSSTSRSRSRGRSSSRASKRISFNSKRSCEDDLLAGIECRRVEEDLPTTVCKMLEETAKFPGLSDNGIVGPMQRDEVMVRTRNDNHKASRFWRSLVNKVRRCAI